MIEVRRFSAGSVFKVSAVLYAILVAVLGLPMALVLALSSGKGLAAALVMYVVGVPLYALLSAVMAALSAWLYNIAVSIVGGVEFEAGGVEIAEEPGMGPGTEWERRQ